MRGSGYVSTQLCSKVLAAVLVVVRHAAVLAAVAAASCTCEAECGQLLDVTAQGASLQKVRLALAQTSLPPCPEHALRKTQ